MESGRLLQRLTGGIREYDGFQFAFFRALLGGYLVWHFLALVPYGIEIFGRHGALGDPRLNPTFGLFPDPLYFFDGDVVVTFVPLGLAILAGVFALGIGRPVMAFLLYFGWASLFNRNNLISNPGLAYLGWILLACTLVPKGEGDGERWEFPRALFIGAWVLLALGYTFSGFEKLRSPSWANGTALSHLLHNPLARDTYLRAGMAALPLPILKVMTWGALAMELAFAPLAFFRRTRPFAWLGIVAMHLGILTVVSFADLTIGMLLVHLFTFDPRWLAPRPATGEQPLVFFDGVCGLCNKAVDLILRADRQAIFAFAPLQGETAVTKLGGSPTTTTIIVLDSGRRLVRSDAVCAIAARLGGLYRALSWYRFLPRPLRDWAYDRVAQNRFRFFGRRDACRMPTPAERGRFLA